ncbi:MAG: hypothetical protein NZM65_05195 [Flavobacteriales bacterium]|nr:hypothetical protein [Flavobacteriales bacterium]MDW8410068.1 hypothetical protein [Flavobacteriales bacterium]
MIFFIPWACGPSKREKEEQLRREVMSIHDEVMPRTEDLYRLRKKIQAVLDSLDTLPLTDTLLRHKARQLILMLRSADDSMMHWMHNYNGGAGLYDHMELMKYLNEEKQKILGVRQAIQEAIDSAQAFLNKL